MKTSRQRVLEYILAHYPVTAADLSQALQMTEANARHHLSILQERGLVQLAGQRPSPGKGRPSRLYRPSEQRLGHNLDQLAAALLALLKSRSSSIELEPALSALAEQIAGPAWQPRQRGAESLTRRLYLAVQRLNEFHYQARWEAWRGAPRLILGHCPYAAILADHPELCRMDARLLELMLDRKATQAARLAPDPQGGTFCLFMLDKP